jgi:Z1 domain
MTNYDLEGLLEDFDLRVQRNGLDSAKSWALERHPDAAGLIFSTYWERIGELFIPRRGLVALDHEPWYFPKADHESPRWAYAKTKLGLSFADVEKASLVADEILARLGNPRGDTITTRGLVLGYVQSGKTTSFLSVAAKAADNGYDLIVILAGVHNSLRRQTQDRAARTLIHKPDLWWVGTAVGDFRPDGNSLSSHLAGNGKRGLLVVKKHSTILERLVDWLEEDTNALGRRAILLIDDEADQAGLDISTGEELVGIHKQLSRVVNLKSSDGCRRCAYLAYTATPYANILTSQDDYGLYPRDFIYPLERPAAYFGSQQLFGDAQVGEPIEIEQDETDELLTDGLREAIQWFVLATAARAANGQPLESFHSSMLIHTTQRTEDQIAYRPVVEGYLQRLIQNFATDEASMREFYARMLAKVPAKRGGSAAAIDEDVSPWETVRLHVRNVLTRLVERTPSGEPFKEDGRIQHAHSGVIVDNSKVDWADRLTYSDLAAGQPSVTVIAIGGNTLSRGLTLEGLVCSYFARTAKTYDSLMQMGRWFGYRPGYRHLVRVWTTQELLDWFRELNQVEEELRQELIWMQEKGLTPDRYGPRIRVSPNMNITRAAAMKSVTRHISYSDTVIDPAWLDLDPEVLKENQRLARELAVDLGTPDAKISPTVVFRGVPRDRIVSFLQSFRFHDEERRVDRPSLTRYIDAEAGRLQSWTVAFKSLGKGSGGSFDFGGDVGEVVPVSRARVKESSVAYIQSLVDSKDHRVDVGGLEPAGRARYRAENEPPLLIVYAVDSVSKPIREGNRAPLNAPSTPISLSLAFPTSDSSVDYVSPAVAAVEFAPDLGDFDDE